MLVSSSPRYFIFSFPFCNASQSLGSVYASIAGLFPISRAAKANRACIFHGTHHLNGPSHVAVGNQTIAVAVMCLQVFSATVLFLHFSYLMDRLTALA